MVLTLLFALGLLAADPLAPGDHQRQITVGESQRRYLVHVPPHANPGQPIPVVLVLHGAATNGRGMAHYTRLNGKPTRPASRWFIPTAPGTGGILLTWNSGGNCAACAKPARPTTWASSVRSSTTWARRHDVDPKRVFATGMSKGAMLCYRLAAELSDRIAAIAPAPAGPRAPNGAIETPGSGDPLPRHRRRVCPVRRRQGR